MHLIDKNQNSVAQKKRSRQRSVEAVRVEHSKSQPTDYKPSLKWAWSRHVTHFKFLVPLRYLWNGLSWRLKFGVHVDHRKSVPAYMDDKLSLKGACSLSRDFYFWKISDNILKTVQDGFIVSIKFEYEVVSTPSNGYVADDLGWPLTTLDHLIFNI